MKKIFKIADEYILNCTWKDLALIKFCLAAAGIMLGIATPKKLRAPVAFTAMTVFVVTYLPLMMKLFRIFRNSEDFYVEDEEEISF